MPDAKPETQRIPELHQVEVEIGVDGGGQKGRRIEEEAGRHRHADKRQLRLSPVAEEIHVIDAEKRDHHEGEKAQESEPSGAGVLADRLDPLQRQFWWPVVAPRAGAAGFVEMGLSPIHRRNHSAAVSHWGSHFCRRGGIDPKDAPPPAPPVSAPLPQAS